MHGLNGLIDTNIPPETNAGFEDIDDFMKKDGVCTF
jgi:hypothetical protein